MSTQTICKSFLLELLQGIHVFGTDTIKLALYTAALDPDVVTAYSATNEAAGTGYAAGGFTLALTATFPKVSSTSRKALVDFADVAANPAAFTTRAGLIYNASKANRAIAAIDFGLSYVAVHNFSLVWPPADDANCLIRLGA